MELFENGRQFLYNIVYSAAKTYHGLMNQGATSYLNSVLQVLFMTEDFREAVKRHICDNSGPELIDPHLTSLFDDLQEYTAYTYKITKKLGIDNVYEQRDAAEYFEKILGLTSCEASQIFHGQQTQKTICSTCSTETGSDTPFWNLTLALVNSYKGDFSVVTGIEEYFRDSYFSGENQMYCDACQAKSDATIKWEIKDHPEVLMLLLKRFQFDYRYMTYVKINCSVNVPCTLQIPENQIYELYAVVDHFGDFRSGHYTATIKPQDSERWYTFNDDMVTLLDNQPFQGVNFERSSSAYLLFYRKKKVHAADSCTQDTGEMSSPGGFLPDIYNDQFEKGEVKREKFEWAAEAEQTIDRNEKPAIKNVVVVGSSGVGLSSDLYKEDQDKQSNQQDCEKGMKSERKERRGIASTRYLDKDEEQRDDEGFDNIRQDKNEDQKGTQKVSQDYYKPVNVDKQEDGQGIKTDGEERKARRGKLLTRQDLNNDDIQDIQGVGKSKQSMSKDDQRFKQRTESRFYQSHEQPREEERDVKGDEQQMRRDDERAQRKGASARQEQDQDGRSERVTTQKGVGAGKQARGDNEHIQRRADSSLRQAGSAGSSRVTENRGEESQPSNARTGLNEDTMEGKRSSKQSKTYYGKIIDEEIRTTHSGVQKSTIIKNVRIKTEGSSRGSLKSLVDYDVGNAELESEPKTDTKVTLSEGVYNLQLTDSPMPKQQKRRNEIKSTIHSNDRKMQNVTGAHAQAVGKKHAVKERGEKKRHLWRRSSPLKQNGKEKKKRKKITYFSFLRKSCKTADQTSESD